MGNNKSALDAYNKMKNIGKKDDNKKVFKNSFPLGNVKKAVFPSGKSQSSEKNITSEKLDKIKDDVHKKVQTEGFTPYRDPTKFSYSKTSGMLKQGLKQNSYKKVAKFLMLLGTDQAVEILKQLEEDEIEKIVSEIAKIRKVDKNEAAAIMQEFSFIKGRVSTPHGGVDTARSILVATYGEEKGRDFLRKVLPDAEEKPFSFLNDLDSTQLFMLLKKESPEVISVILPCLEPKVASEIMKNLPDKDKGKVALKVAKGKRPTNMAINIIEESLRDKVRNLGLRDTESIDGSGALANILKYMDVSTEQDIINELDDESPALSEAVKEKIFTIDMIVNIEDTDLQKVLADYSDYALAVIIKGKSREVEDKILNCVSDRRAAFIRDERELIGAMKREEVDIETKAFLNHLKRLHLQGEILLRMVGEEYV